ncbi:ABC transporter permease subunit [uncultured Desulfobacter sp.]|uniref:ABC transporter permease n=1 Tax=uncultured Desulfobacter sp. TaxID=240139 RepID=UPI002AAC28B0|nr:ABC transporter permease subunit [uncultured Desulfobacter sp.]
MKKPRVTALLCTLLGIAALAFAWHLASQRFSGLVVPRPLETLGAGVHLLSDTDFLSRHLWISLERMSAALGAGIMIGGSFGLLAGFVPRVRAFIEPVRWMLTTVPGVVIVIVFMLWFGMGDTMVVAISAAMGAPVIFVNLADAMGQVDTALLEMARVYRFSPWTRLTKIYAMAAAGPFFSALVIAAGTIVRVAVLAEVLGADQGIGHCMSIARTRMDTPALYALALISMCVAGGAEFFIFRPLERRMTGRWE